MGEILSAIVLAALTVFAVISPPLVILVYVFVSYTGDVIGVAAFLDTQHLQLLTKAIRAVALLACLSSYVRIVRDTRRGDTDRRVLLLANVLLFCVAWIAVGSLWKDFNVLRLPTYLLESGIPIGLVSLAYWRDRRARVCFVAGLAAVLLVSIAVVKFPDTVFGGMSALGVVDVSDMAYREELQRGVVSGLSRTDGAIARAFGPHMNTNGWGLYSCIGLVIGAALLIASRGRSVKAGAVIAITASVIIVASVVGWSWTVSRGPTVGLVGGVLVLQFCSGRKRLMRALASIAAIALLSWYAATMAPVLVDLFAGEDAKAAVQDRVELLESGMEQVQAHPLVGAPLRELSEIPPHQLPAYYATRNGLPVAIGSVFLLWCCFPSLHRWGGAVRQAARSPLYVPSADETRVATLFAMTILGTAFTNNFGAPTLFWVCWGFAAATWIGMRSRHSSRTIAPRAARRSRSRDSVGMVVTGATDVGAARLRLYQ